MTASDTPSKIKQRMTKQKAGWVPITEEVLATLKFHRERTGVSAGKLMSGSADAPKGLNEQTIQNWVGKRAKTARKDFLEYVILAWTAAPSKAEQLEITEEIRSTLLELKKQTGFLSQPKI